MRIRFNEHLVPAFISVALLLPLLFASSRSTAPLHIGLPQVHSGDEPHYLTLINSMILDGDLDLANNYAAIHQGASQAGLNFVGGPLDHQTVWFDHGSRKKWPQVYEIDPSRWDRDGQGNPVPRLRPGQPAPPLGHSEYSIHPPGVALLLAPILFPFRDTQYIEPLAISCSTLAVIAAMFMFRLLLAKYSSNIHVINLVTITTFLGTPAWHYGRSLFNEPYLLLFAIGAYSVTLRGKSPLVAGAFIALGMLMKPPFALLIIPLCLMYIVERNFRSVAFLLLPAVVAFAAILSLNTIMFGSPLRAAQDWVQGSFFIGAMGTLFSLQYGYLITTPAVVVAIAVWPTFFRAFSRDAAVLILGIILHFAFFSSYAAWSGASCYGARYMVPILPLLFVALARLPDTLPWRKRWARAGIIAICALSVGNNAIAAMPYWAYWDSNPLLTALQWSFGI